MVCFVVYMIYETGLSLGSIQNYTWGLRTHMKLQRQFDPVFGVVEWDDFQQGVAVVAWCQNEPSDAVQRFSGGCPPIDCR